MVTAPLVIILAIATFLAVKYGSAKPGSMVLGVLFGLSLASTTIGPPMLGALQDGMTSVVSSVSAVAGAR